MPRSAYLWCPAYPLGNAAQQASAIATAQRLTEALGLKLVISPLLDRHPGPGAWLSADERRADLRYALGPDHSHDLLIAARGGYGCIDLLPDLLAHPGPLPGLVGYSDLSLFHAWYFRQQAPAWYGFMPGVTTGPRALASTLALMRGEGLRCDATSDPGVTVLRPGHADGRMFPTCLRILASLAGTPALPDLTGAILAIEDIDERPYQIDRDLNQLHAAGALRGVSGLVGGRFPCATLPPGYAGPSSAAILQIWAERLAVPAIIGLGFGHEDDPVTLPNGTDATLEARNGVWGLRGR
jgi:muramoyltetrapeptide carboxypeptidase